MKIGLAVHPMLERFADPNDELHGKTRAALAAGITGVLEVLGLPGEADVAMSTADEAVAPHTWARVHVNGTVCRYDDEMTRAARAAALASHEADDERDVTRWVARAADETPDVAVAFLRAAVVAVVSDSACELASPAVLEAYRRKLGGVADPGRLDLALRHALHHRVSVADRATVARVLHETRDRDPLDAAEALLAELRPAALEVRLSEDHLRNLTTSDAVGYHGLFDFLRVGLYRELGIVVPPLRLTRLGDGAGVFALTINHLPVSARPGLEPEECLVNMAPSGLESSLKDAVRGSADNPGSGLENARIGVADRAVAEEAGLTTWTALEYLTLTLAADLRHNAACLVDVRMTDEVLDRLEPAAPALVCQARARIPVERITGVIRALLTEQESARNLPAVLERLLDADEAAVAGPVALREWVRGGLAPAIASRHALGSGTVIAYLLDQRIEELMTANGPPGEPVVDALLEAIRQEISLLPPTVSLPCLLTTAPVRLRLRESMSGEFPRMPVLSYDDLPRSINVQPVARITLAGTFTEAMS